MSRLLHDLSDGVVPKHGLPERATRGVESASVQQARVASGVHRGLHGPAQPVEAHRIDKLMEPLRGFSFLSHV